jgi:hypothetical protein
MKLYKLFHYLSLDIVFGALASSVLAARLFSASPGWSWWLALALSVWVLYMGDHILDAWKYRKTSKRDLHIFIFRNRRILLWLMGVGFIVDMLLIFNFLDSHLLKYALGLAGLVLLFYALRYFFRENKVLFIPGEIFVMIFYLAGTWLGPYILRSGPLHSADWLVAIMVAGILLMNLAIISLYDIKVDSRLGITSLAQYIGKDSTRTLILITAIAVYGLSVMQFLVHGSSLHSQLALVLSGMATLMLTVLYLPSYFRKNDHYRLAADAILLMGFLSLLIKG